MSLKVIAFRGEHGPSELQTHVASFSFSDQKKTAEYYALEPNNRQLHPTAEAPKVITAELTIQNPFINTPEDPFLDFSVLPSVFTREEIIALAIRFEDYVTSTNNWDEHFSGQYVSVSELLRKSPESINLLYMLAFPLLDDQAFVDKLKAAGYDGAIHAGYGENSCEIEYKVFSTEQINILEVTEPVDSTLV